MNETQPHFLITMDTSYKNSVWKPSLNKCTYCHADGCYKDISTEYYYSGQKEVYEDMLKETFNIQISYKEGSCTSRRFICDECIKKLRNAYIFKQNVLRSEYQFTMYLDMYLNLENGADANISNDENMKVEPLEIEDIAASEMPSTITYDDRQNGDSNDGHDINVDNKREQRKETQKEFTIIAERRGNGPILRYDALKLLENSTMCVFQWHKSRYRCYCCKEPFSDMNTLKEHTHTKHTLSEIEKIIIYQQNRLVKVEISSLHCKLCQEPVDCLPSLRKHLTETHDIQFQLTEDLLVPFKIDNFTNIQCQICMENFTAFWFLNRHMNKHFQKLVCHICGLSFSNRVFLNLHKTRTHRPICCKECDMVFANRSDKRNHDVTAHNVKIVRKLRFPCPYCSERFFQDNLRAHHLVEKHGMVRPEYKCTICPKSFITRSLSNNHMRKCHMKEKNHECDICQKAFYTNSDLLRHRETHSGEKKFSCTFCNNHFASKVSLRRHVLRIHSGML